MCSRTEGKHEKNEERNGRYKTEPSGTPRNEKYNN